MTRRGSAARAARGIAGSAAVAAIAAWAALAPRPLFAGDPPAGEAAQDEREREIVRRDCSNTMGRNEVTLFANGTVRLRDWTGEKSDMFLEEIGRDEVDAYVRRIDLIDFKETPERQLPGVSGEWVERCDLAFEYRGGRRQFRYGALDTHDLALGTMLRLVDELAALAASRAATGELPADYQPRRGDLLARTDGVEFEVVGFTVVGDGVELRGRLDPLTVYISKGDLPRQFRRVLKRGP